MGLRGKQGNTDKYKWRILIKTDFKICLSNRTEFSKTHDKCELHLKNVTLMDAGNWKCELLSWYTGYRWKK